MQVCFIAKSRVISGVEGVLRRAGDIRRIALIVHTFIGFPILLKPVPSSAIKALRSCLSETPFKNPSVYPSRDLVTLQFQQ